MRSLILVFAVRILSSLGKLYALTVAICCSFICNNDMYYLLCCLFPIYLPTNYDKRSLEVVVLELLMCKDTSHGKISIFHMQISRFQTSQKFVVAGIASGRPVDFGYIFSTFENLLKGNLQ